MNKGKLNFLESINYKLLQKKLSSFKPKVIFNLEIKGFVIKTAEHPDELREVLKLRYDIFTKEYGVKMQFEDIDFDRFDLMGDHVLVIEESTGKILATYRVLCSLFADKFYSQTEFHMENFLKSPGIKMELGRACVHEDFRSGALIGLVWRGIAKYSMLTGSDYMFGCTSIDTTDPKLSMAIFRHLKDEHFSDRFGITPTKKYSFESYPELIPVDVMDQVEEYIPGLLKSYFKAGAKIHSLPAVDWDFNCIDLFTSINLRKVNPQIMKRYF